MALSFKCFNNSKKLIIMSFILCFYKIHFSKKKIATRYY